MGEQIIWEISGVLFFISIVVGISQPLREISHINKKLDIISKQIGIPDLISEDIKIELKQLASQGKIPKAIKRYRILTGEGLKEAKEFINSLDEVK